MSKTIDERVVEMQFNNSQFEKNVATSMSTLDKLKQSLKFKDVSSGFKDISSASSSVNMSSLENAVESVKIKFSALEVMAITALSNITNSAVNAGMQLVKSLSTDQISAGWQKFGSKTTSVATLVAQGNDIDVVNDQMERLNWFTDETSYNFTDMVSNIAKFTATGKGLNESVTAMEGIATWAALSGQNAATASNAMYQLSQAMGAGVMRKEDYKSIQNASMDTAEFRQKAMDAAVALGTLKQNADGTYTSIAEGAKKITFDNAKFAESLTEGAWFTSDVMMKVFNDYSSAVEGIYSAAEEKGMLASEVIDEIHDKAKAEGISTDEAIKALGYDFDSFALKAFEAAQKARTFGDAIDSVKDAVSTGWMNTFELLFGDAEEATELWTDLANRMWDVFASGGEARNEVLKEWKELGGRDDFVEGFFNTWDTFFGDGDEYIGILGALKEAFSEVFPPITGERLKEITEKFKNFTEKIKPTEAQLEKLKSAFKGIFSVVSIFTNIIGKLIGGVAKLLPNLASIGNAILNVAGSFGDFISGVLDIIKNTDVLGKVIDGLVNFIQNAIDKLKEFFNALKEKISLPGVDSAISAFEKLWNILGTIGSKIAGVASKIGNSLSSAFKSGGLNNALDLLNGGLFAGLLLGLNKFVNGGILDKVKGALDSLFEPFEHLKEKLGGVTSLLDGVKGCLQAYQNDLKANVLIKIAAAIAILAAALVVLASIDPARLGTAITGITALFAELVGAMAILETINFGKSKKAIGDMIKVAAAVLILAFALKEIGELDWDQLGIGLAGVTVLLGEVVAASIILSKYGGQIKKCGLQMILIAAALKILASVCEELSKLDWEQLAKGTSAVGVFLLEIAGFNALMTKIKPSKMLSAAASMIIIGIAMEIFADVAQKFGQLDWNQLAKAGAAIGGILLIAAGFANLSKFASKMVGASIALAIIGGAMEIFADVVQKFGKLDWDQLAKAGAAIGGILLLAAGFALLSGLSSKMARSAIALAIIGGAMEIFADVVQKFSIMDWSQLAKAGAAIGGILLLAAGFALLGGLAPGMGKASVSLLIMAAALSILTPVLEKLGEMPCRQIAKGLIAMAAAFTIIGIAGLLLGPLVPAILGLGAAIALLGIGCAAVGAGVMMLGIGLTALAASGTAAAAALVSSILIVLNGLGDMIVAVCNAIANSAEAIGRAVKAVILTLVDVFVECLPALVTGVMELISQLLDALIDYAPQITDKLVSLFIQIIDSLSSRMGDLIDSLKAFVISVMDGLESAIPDLVAKGVELIGVIIQAIADALGPLVEQVIGPLAESLGDAISKIADGMAPIVQSVSEAIQAICDAFISLVEQISPIIDSITALVQQLGDSISQVFQSISDVISTCGNTISQVLSSVGDIISSVFSGISDVITSVGDSIRTVLDGISGIIESIGEAALNAGTGFENLANGVRTITELNLLDMAASLGTVAAGIADIAKNSSGLAEAGSGMQQLSVGAITASSAISGMSGSISSVVSSLSAIGPAASFASSAITGMSSAFESIGPSVSSAVASMMQGFVAGVQSYAGQINSTFTILITNLLTTINARNQMFYTSGVGLSQRLAAGIQSQTSFINAAIRMLIQNGASALSSYYIDFYNAGGYLVQGFANGISANTFMAEAQARAMARAAYNAARSQLDINSPSKVFRKLAYSVPEGFAQGIERKTWMSNEASTNMAQSAIDSATNVLSNIGDTLSSDLNLQPAIRPVVDMSNAEMTSLDLGSNIDVSLNGHIDSLSQLITGAQTDIRNSNLEVINAINGLREDLNAIGVSLGDHETALYVDSKKLATSLAKPMNRQLNILSQRGSYA